MFKAANAFDEIVTKATDENLTSENWELNLNVCDKVSSQGETGARDCVAAILKRLVHRNANVQLYALTLADALSKNCGIVAHRELASRSFCQTLQRIIVDRNTNGTVKRKGVSLVKEWTSEWGSDETLGVMRETKDALRQQGISFEDAPRDPPPEPSSEQLRKEDEELRRVLELSLQDQGGRGGYQASSSGGPSSGAQASSSAGAAAGYAPSSNTVNKQLPDPGSQFAAASASAPPQPEQPAQKSGPAASRVRAMYDFVPSEEGELAFRKGDVIRVLDSVYEHWWRGELNGVAGIFPVNYVEILPDPSPADIQREAELEARIFAQANDIDRLLSKLRGLDPNRDNLADDEELQELYQSSLSMRPKIVKLIDRYNLKVTELRSMNEKFVRARTTYDAMMQENAQRHAPPQQAARPNAGGYGPPPESLQPGSRVSSYGQGPPGAAPGGYPSQQQPHPTSTHGYAPQDQQYDYNQQYAQQGYAAQQQPSAPPQGTPAPQQQPPQGQPQLPPGAPPYGTPEYAQWYYAQQQQQHPTQPQAGSAAMPNGPPTADGAVDDDEKRRMFERARAEADVYHRAHQQQQYGQPSEGAPSAQLL